RGAAGFLVKDTPPTEIIRAIELVAAGESMLSPAVTRRLIDRLSGDRGGEGEMLVAACHARADRPPLWRPRGRAPECGGRRPAGRALTARARDRICRRAGELQRSDRRPTPPQPGDGEGPCVGPTDEALARQPRADRPP